MHQFAAFLIGLVSAMVGAIAAGGGLISIPGLIFLGLSPVAAIATSRLNILSGGSSAVYQYTKSDSVQWKYMPYFLVLGLLAGFIGPKLLLDINPQLVGRAVGAMLIIMLPLVWLNHEAGLKNIKRTRQRKLWGIPTLLLVLIYAVMFGGGGGVLLIYTFVYFFGMTITEANATGLAVSIFATLVALVTYISNNAVDWSLGIPIMLGALLGGYLGAHFALKNGVAWVKTILTVVITASAVKLLFFH